MSEILTGGIQRSRRINPSAPSIKLTSESFRAHPLDTRFVTRSFRTAEVRGRGWDRRWRVKSKHALPRRSRKRTGLVIDYRKNSLSSTTTCTYVRTACSYRVLRERIEIFSRLIDSVNREESRRIARASRKSNRWTLTFAFFFFSFFWTCRIVKY